MSWMAYIGLLDRGGVAEVVTLDAGKPAQVIPQLKNYKTAEAVRGLLALGGLDKLGKTPQQSSASSGSHKSFKFPVEKAQDAGKTHNADNIFLFDEGAGRWKRIDLGQAGTDLHPIAARIARRRIARLYASVAQLAER